MSLRSAYQAGTNVPQTQPLPDRPEMTPNNAGGYGWTVSHWEQLDRFLTQGSEGGTYYVGEGKLTVDNAQAVAKCLREDGTRAVARIVQISREGRAPKNDPAVFALAMAASIGSAKLPGSGDTKRDTDTRRAALGALPIVCRIGTHLFQFADSIELFRGWGRGLRRAVADWYRLRGTDALALQMVKYAQRGGWSHRDMLRLGHPEVPQSDAARRALLDYACRGLTDSNRAALPAMVLGREELHAMVGNAGNDADVSRAVKLIAFHSLPREAIPTELLNRREVWDALLADMPPTAMIRNLGKMTAVGALAPLSAGEALVCRVLADRPRLKQARVHPIALLIALKTYAQGRAEKGKLTWQPSSRIIDALDAAFYAAFDEAPATGKRLLVGVDCSGSMSTACLGASALRCDEAAGAMAMTFLRTEPNAHILGFNERPVPVNVSARQRLDDVVNTFRRIGGGTDVSAPVRYALDNRLHVDAIVVLTDAETWAGRSHNAVVLREYRAKVNPNAKLVCLSAAANTTTVVDPTDRLSLGVAGFDAAVPQVVADFLAA